MHSLPLTSLKERRLRWGALLLGCSILGMNSSSHATSNATAYTVTIEAMQISPATLEVKVGDTVTWKNKDPFPHTVTSSGGQFDSGDIKSGGSWKFKAKKKGVYPYVCTLHPTMKAVLVVK